MPEEKAVLVPVAERRSIVKLVYVVIGTKAQYIKTAPLLHLMDSREIPYRLIDTGQHGLLSRSLRRELGVREPDVLLSQERDVVSIAQAIRWSSGLLLRSRSRTWLRSLFPELGVCLVHGDTPSTLLAAALGRRRGLSVAHLEAGLRSFSYVHPFPEEAIRVAVTKMSDLLLAPGPWAASNLLRMGVKGMIVELSGNTTVDAVRRALGDEIQPGSGPVVVTTHRVENLKRRDRMRSIAALAMRIHKEEPVHFVVHGPTDVALRKLGLFDVLEDRGVRMLPLQGYREFLQALARARFVVTDGGSVQEECAVLGVPTLLWRARTERPEGLNENVVLSRYDSEVIGRFLANPEKLRRPLAGTLASPAEEALEAVVSYSSSTPPTGYSSAE